MLLEIYCRKGGGHVAIVMGQSKDGKHLYVLGGNQRDSVNIAKYPKSAWTNFRVPVDYNDQGCILPVYKGASTARGKES